MLIEAVVQFKDNLFENSLLSVSYFVTDSDLSGTWQLWGNDVVTPSCITWLILTCRVTSISGTRTALDHGHCAWGVPGHCGCEGGGRQDGWWTGLLRELLFWTSIRQYLMLKNIILTRWISTTLIFCYKGFFPGKHHTFVKTEVLEKSKLHWKFPSRLALRILVPVQALLGALFVSDLNMSLSVLINDRQESWSSHSGVPWWARLVWTVSVSIGFANWGEFLLISFTWVFLSSQGILFIHVGQILFWFLCQ